MQSSELDRLVALEARVVKCEEAICELLGFVVTVRDAMVSYTENHNKCVKSIENTIVKLNALIQILFIKGVITNRDYENSLEKMSLHWFHTNPQEAVNRFLMDISKEFEKMAKKEEGKKRRKASRIKKYDKQYKS